jgi:hypothetical protein
MITDPDQECSGCLPGARGDMRAREGGCVLEMIGSIVGTKEKEDMHAATKGGMIN